ncbi:hypothetical protein L227DRAFT_94918 [Lentinus tigrinus ALCF2SS1-6]|uniref:Uncharacterized protein n=1 Tax=Lentinus tigrinus ALCF2SS1-6 TaxID=1328759 RepID=A0A5C2RNV2_9APHY|nr:hypothetical protein L227DRAFT_94918 [Lentinus tigrinus ALCF2SS1-6]
MRTCYPTCPTRPEGRVLVHTQSDSPTSRHPTASVSPGHHSPLAALTGCSPPARRLPKLLESSQECSEDLDCHARLHIRRTETGRTHGPGAQVFPGRCRNLVRGFGANNELLAAWTNTDGSIPTQEIVFVPAAGTQVFAIVGNVQDFASTYGTVDVA